MEVCTGIVTQKGDKFILICGLIINSYALYRVLYFKRSEMNTWSLKVGSKLKWVLGLNQQNVSAPI